MGCKNLNCFQRRDLINPDPIKFTKQEEILNLLRLTLGVAVQCDNKEDLISVILTSLDESVQTDLMKIIQ